MTIWDSALRALRFEGSAVSPIRVPTALSLRRRLGDCGNPLHKQSGFIATPFDPSPFLFHGQVTTVILRATAVLSFVLPLI